MSDFLWWITYSNKKHLPDLINSMNPDEDYELVKCETFRTILAKKWNEGLRQIGKYKSVIISNDDVILKPDTGKSITKILDKAGRATKTLIVSAYDINLHKGDFGNIWVPSKTMYPQSFMFAVDERLIETVGEFDERFYPYLFEDTDMFHRIKTAGYDWATAVPVWHVGGGSVTTERMVRQRNHFFKTNREKYIEKWGGEPGKELWTTPKSQTSRYDQHAFDAKD